MRTLVWVMAAMLAAAGTVQAGGPNGSIVGEYVEARTAEVFVGGCQLGNEGEQAGRQAVLAWRVRQGAFGGVRLDGLSVVAAVAGNTNLGWYELGGRKPSVVKAAVMVDERATAAQRLALVALARTLSNGLVSDIVEVKAVPIAFRRADDRVEVVAGDAGLSVATRLEHDPSCGAMRWFSPLARATDASVGVTRTTGYWGRALGTRWSQQDRRSAFFGTFTY
jgi:hypothetical protein